jgi:hypothetical protein
MTTYVVHSYPVTDGTTPIVELDLDWATDESYTFELSKYHGVEITEIGNHPVTGWPIIRVVGALEQVAHWVLIEYCGGDIEPANELISAAKVPSEAHRPHSSEQEVKRDEQLLSPSDD